MLPHYLNLIPILYWEIFLKLEKKFQALLEKKPHGPWLECNDMPGNSNAGPTTCILREEKEFIILFFLSEDTS
jgi:hypothetical protein